MDKFPHRGSKVALIGLALGLAATASHAQSNARIAQPAVPMATPVQPALSGAELVDRLLRPRPSDPDVPLPSPDLADRTPEGRPLSGPTVYGRSEDGGGVFGVKIPIPADRRSTGSNTRYSPPN